MGRDRDTYSVFDICEKYLARRDEKEKVIEIVERCIIKKYDYEKMRERVLEVVSDYQKGSKIVQAVSSTYPELRKRARFAESKDDGESSSKRQKTDREDKDRRDKGDRRDRDRDDKSRERSGKSGREKQSSSDDVKKHSSVEEPKIKSSVTEDTLRAKELLYKAQQEIEERKRQMSLKPPAAGVVPAAFSNVPVVHARNAVLNRNEASMFMNYSMDQKDAAKLRIEELKAKIDQKRQQTQLPVVPQVTEDPSPQTDLVKKEVVERKPVVENEFLEYLDPRMDARPAERKRRAFNFAVHGEYEKMANKQRSLAKLEKLQAEISLAAKSTGISAAVKLELVTPAGRSSNDIVPECEWWDTPLLASTTYDSIPPLDDDDRFKDTLSDLVEHPIKLKPPTEPLVPQYLKVYLTTHERKKIRRQNRKEMQKEKTEKIRLGLEKAPEAKVKISNLMRVLGTDAIQDPSKMEAHVRKQMADRLKKHEEANAERKLTDEQRAAKKTKKLSEDTSIATNVAIYRVKSLMHPSKKFKVEQNAKQLQMTGVILLHKNINVVVVEGGPKQQKFYKNLMMTRIKWEDEIIGQKKDAEKDAPGERNQCQLIWEGQIKKRNFRDMTVITATIEKQARDILEKHSVAQYWDLAYSTSVLLEDQDPLPLP